MAKEIYDIRELLEFDFTNKIMIAGVESHFDEISSHIVIMHAYMTTLLGPLMIQAASDKLKVTREAVLSKMALVLKHMMAVCAACEYELPDEDTIQEMEYDMAFEIGQDSILTLTNMMMASLDIIHIVNVGVDQKPIWTEEHVHPDFEQSIIAIILGIRHLGLKYSFTVRDVLLEL